MAVIVDPQFPNLQNLMSRLKPDGGVETDLVNTMVTAKPMLEDIPWKEANEGTGHRISEVTGIPAPSRRKLNQGTPPTKGQTAQFIEACGMMDDWSIVDAKLVDIKGRGAAFRDSEDRIKEEGFAQEVARALLYDNSIDTPEEIYGIMPRYTGKAGTRTEDYVMKRAEGGGANCESILLIDWDPDKIFGIYPEGTVAGLTHEDKGKQIVETSPGFRMNAYVTYMAWDFGLAIRDFRKVVHLQWDPEAPEFGAEKKGLFLAIQEMIDTIPSITGNARLYMSRLSRTRLNMQLLANSAGALEYLELGKRRIPSYMGLPIRVEETLVPGTPL